MKIYIHTFQHIYITFIYENEIGKLLFYIFKLFRNGDISYWLYI